MRSVFVIGPDKKIKLMLTYPMTTGRNFDEILRVLDSMQLTAKHKVATPVNWKQGEDVIIAASVSDDDAKKLFPGWKTPKPYLRTTQAAELRPRVGERTRSPRRRAASEVVPPPTSGQWMLPVTTILPLASITTAVPLAPANDTSANPSPSNVVSSDPSVLYRATTT